MVQIILGGVAGVVLAQVILWWIPLNLSVANRDLTGFGRKYGGYVPFLVPASVRGAADPYDAAESSTAPSAAGDGAGSGMPAKIPDYRFAEGRLDDAGSGAGPSDGKLPEKTPSSPGGEAADAPESSGQVDEADADPTGSQDPLPAASAGGPSESDDDLDLLFPDLPSTQTGQPGMDSNASASASNAAGIPPIQLEDPTADQVEGRREGQPEFPRLKNIPNIDGAELQRHIDSALATQQELDAQPMRVGAQDPNLVKEFYQSYAEAGAALVMVNPMAQELDLARDSARASLQGFSTQPERLKLIATVTPSWMKSGKSPFGILLYGTIRDVRPLGSLLEAGVETGSRQPSLVRVVTTPAAGSSWQPGTEVLVLGLMVDAPGEQLVGYDGDAKRVVVDGVHYVWSR
jgi:hypothetical protein